MAAGGGEEDGEKELTVEDMSKQAEEQGVALSEATDLTLRDLGVTSAGSAFLQTPCIEVLSLSHNKLSSLAGFQHLRNVQHLNLNFNSISTLEGIGACKQLRKLFLSNNSVSELQPLAGCPHLQCLSLFGNQVSNLDSAVFTLGSLADLVELDLSGNPVESSPAYKHRLVSDLTSLTSLDGEPITPRDSEVAERFFERHTEYRPTSAVGSGRPGTSEASERPETPSGLPPRPSSSGGPKDAQLFRSEFLNNHPILLEYIVEGATGSRPSSARPGSARPLSREREGTEQQAAMHRSNSQGRRSGSGGRRRSFVDRLRGMAADMNATETLTREDLAGGGGISFQASALEEELLGPEAAESPQNVIRRLLQICEQLEKERDDAEEALKTAHGRQHSALTWGETELVVRQLEKLQAENKRLTSENKNMYILLEENRQLKATIADMQQNTRNS